MAPGDPTLCGACSAQPGTFLLQSYAEWLQEVKEKGPELLKQPPVNTEPSVSAPSSGCCPSVPRALPGLWVRRVPEPVIGQLGETFAFGSETPVLPSVLRTWPPS